MASFTIRKGNIFCFLVNTSHEPEPPTMWHTRKQSKENYKSSSLNRRTIQS